MHAISTINARISIWINHTYSRQTFCLYSDGFHFSSGYVIDLKKQVVKLRFKEISKILESYIFNGLTFFITPHFRLMFKLMRDMVESQGEIVRMYSKFIFIGKKVPSIIQNYFFLTPLHQKLKIQFNLVKIQFNLKFV